MNENFKKLVDKSTNYFDSSGNINKNLLDELAEKIAEGLVIKDEKGEVKEKESVSSAQLRKFYNEFKSLEKKISGKEERFTSILPLIKMVRSKAAYSSNPKNRKIPESFNYFISKNIQSIEKKEEFETFLLLFEAVVGFCYGRGMKKN